MPALATLTGTTLLEGLRDPANETLWTAYVERYRPLIVAFLTRVRVPAADREDIAQAALAAFAVAYRDGRYDRERGRLRSWLFGIVHNHHRAWLRQRQHGPARLGESASAQVLEVLEGQGELEQAWDAEWRGEVLRRATAQVRTQVSADTWRAFELFALQDISAAEAALRLGTTRAKVFGAKRRVLDRLRDLLPLIEDTL